MSRASGTTASREAVGARFDPTLMRRARERSWAALHAIRARMQPGISEAEAVAMAGEVFAELGSERLWHKPLIRIGRNTTKAFREPSERGCGWARTTAISSTSGWSSTATRATWAIPS
ncbi:hypothetical protein RLIN73S_04818 [Rhodanobacter lindaniclasticus]